MVRQRDRKCERWTDEHTDRRTDGQTKSTEKRMDRRMDIEMGGQTEVNWGQCGQLWSSGVKTGHTGTMGSIGFTPLAQSPSYTS